MASGINWCERYLTTAGFVGENVDHDVTAREIVCHNLVVKGNASMPIADHGLVVKDAAGDLVDDDLAAAVSSFAARGDLLGNGALSSGQQSVASGTNAVALGADARAAYDHTVAVGYEAVAGATVGGVGDDAFLSIAIGRNAQTGTVTGTSSEGAISIGANTRCDGEHCIAIGSNNNPSGGARARENRSIAIGSGVNPNSGVAAAGIDSIALGTDALTSATNAVAIGTSADADAAGSVALGTGAAVAGLPDSIAFGAAMVDPAPVTGPLANFRIRVSVGGTEFWIPLHQF
jgi:hypothetical protein